MTVINKRLFNQHSIEQAIIKDLKEEFVDAHETANALLRAQKGCSTPTRRMLCKTAMFAFNLAHEAHRDLLIMEGE